MHEKIINQCYSLLYYWLVNDAQEEYSMAHNELWELLKENDLERFSDVFSQAMERNKRKFVGGPRTM